MGTPWTRTATGTTWSASDAAPSARYLAAMILLLACTTPEITPVDYAARGPHPVGHRALQVEGLRAELWYPAAEDVEGAELVSAFTEGEQARIYEELLETAECASTETTSGLDAAMLEGSFPLLVFSHCHECTRFSSFTVAERLASHGFLVAAADHDGNTLFDGLAGAGLDLDTDTLALRVQQQHALLDAALQIEGADASTVGAFGHSFGSVTTGMLAQERGEVRAALGLAAPMENPLLPGVTVADLSRPLGFLVAIEDNSITELGNQLIRTNFEDAGQAWKAEVADAGHWSFSDLVGLIDDFEPGCGVDTRQTDGSAFTYMDPELGRSTAATFTTAFFAETLLRDEGALERLGWELEVRP